MNASEKRLKSIIRGEIRKHLSEQENDYHPPYDASEKTIKIRMLIIKKLLPEMNELIKKISKVDSDKADWAEGIREDINDVSEELFDLGNELSMI